MRVDPGTNLGRFRKIAPSRGMAVRPASVSIRASGEVCLCGALKKAYRPGQRFDLLWSDDCELAFCLASEGRYTLQKDGTLHASYLLKKKKLLPDATLHKPVTTVHPDASRETGIVFYIDLSDLVTTVKKGANGHGR